MRNPNLSSPLTLQFTMEEKDYLLSALADRLGTIRESIYHAETTAFKDGLKREEKLVRNLIDKLGYLAQKVG